MTGSGRGHGGGRRKGLTSSWELEERQCLLILEAASDALGAGAPFNRWVTILWERFGVSPDRASAATTQFIAQFGDLLRRYGHKARWAYVHEGGARNGIHAHILLHVPEPLDLLFRSRPRAWSAALAPGGYRKGLVKVRRAPILPEVDRHRYAAWLEARVHYMLKSADASLETKLGLLGRGPRPWGEPSHVLGKRAAAWQIHKQRG
jgi:hypothetical protein